MSNRDQRPMMLKLHRLESVNLKGDSLFLSIFTFTNLVYFVQHYTKTFMINEAIILIIVNFLYSNRIPFKSANKLFSKQIKHCFKENIKSKEQQMMEKVPKDCIYYCIRTTFEHFDPDLVKDIISYGSDTLGIALSTSDYDLSVVLNDNSQNKTWYRQHFLTALKQRLQQEYNGVFAAYIQGTAHPILHIEDNQSTFQADVSIDDGYVSIRNKIMQEWIHKIGDSNTVRENLLFIKLWSKNRRINGSYANYISSFAYTLLYLAAFCIYGQCNHIESMISFFWWLGYVLNPSRNVIQIKSYPYAAVVPRSAYSGYECLYLTDPVNNNSNVTYTLSFPNWYHIQLEARTAYLMCIYWAKHSTHLNRSFSDYLLNGADKQVTKWINKNQLLEIVPNDGFITGASGVEVDCDSDNDDEFCPVELKKHDPDAELQDTNITENINDIIETTERYLSIMSPTTTTPSTTIPPSLQCNHQ